MLNYVRSAGVVSLLLTVAAMIGLPDYFWMFVCLVYAAILIWWLDLIFEKRVQTQGRVARVVVTVCAAGLALWFTFGFVRIGVPLGLSARNISSSHQPGISIAGIVWSPKFSDFRVLLSNDTDDDFSELDLVVKPNEPVVAVGINHELADATLATVSFSAVTTISYLEMARISAGSSFDVPLVLLATDSGYRVRCADFPRQSSIEIVMAIATINMNKGKSTDALPSVETSGPILWKGYVMQTHMSDGTNRWFRQQNDPITDDFWGIPPKPTIVNVDGSYIAAHRRIRVSDQRAVVPDIIIRH